MKKTLGLIAGSLLLAAPVMAADAPVYNCDYQPSCEVAPGIYGAMGSPVKSKFDLSIGGFVRLDYAYNSQNFGANGLLYPGPPGGSLNAVGTVAAKQDQTQLSARVSRFWLKVAGPTFLGAKTNALLEADFLGGGQSSNEAGNLRMRHAYGTLDWANTQVLFGQTNDMFGPAIANTVDFRQGATTGSPNNPRLAQIRVTQKVPFDSNNSLKIVFGVQNPIHDSNTTTAPTATTPGGSDGSIPDVAGQVMFISNSLGKAPGLYGLAMNPLTVGVFGLYGTEKSQGQRQNVDVYGYGVYAFVPLLKSSDGKNRAMTASLEAQAYISAGMAWNGANATTPATFSGGANDALVGVNPNKSAAKGYGLYGQLEFYATQDLGITGGYMRRNAYNYSNYRGTGLTTAAAPFEQYNELIYGNVAYDLNAAVRVAAEYEHGKTQFGSVPTGATGNFGQVNIARAAAYYFF